MLDRAQNFCALEREIIVSHIYYRISQFKEKFLSPVSMDYITKTILKKIYKPRPQDSHKYDFGQVLVIGGSQVYSGSPALAALAALRAGVDLTLVIAPERAANIIASFSPDLISFPLKGPNLNPSHLEDLISLTKKAQKVSQGRMAIVIGGGLGRGKETQETVRKYLSKIDIPTVVDADAIWAISKKKEILKGKKFILTPHSYEFFVLSGKNVSNLSLKEKIKAVKDVAQKLGTVILLKGNIDIISDGKEIFLNKTGCPEMTVGGTGDTLAGVCGCFLSQGFKPVLAASAAAYLNGKAGELAKKNLGPGLLATDIIKYIPKAIKDGLS